MIKVLFFAHLREQLGTAEHRLENFTGTVRELRDRLCEQFPDWHKKLAAADIQVAVNQEMARFETPVGEGDEVAFFPPVTGG